MFQKYVVSFFIEKIKNSIPLEKTTNFLPFRVVNLQKMENDISRPRLQGGHNHPRPNRDDCNYGCLFQRRYKQLDLTKPDFEMDDTRRI